MPDHIFYETASGRVARRDYKSTADLQNALDGEHDPQDAEALQKAIDRRVQLGSRSQTVAKGLNWALARFKNVTENFGIAGITPDSIAAAVTGTQSGELSATYERELKRAQLLGETIHAQKELKARYDGQIVADRQREREKEKAASAARSEKIAEIRGRRKKRGSS